MILHTGLFGSASIPGAFDVMSRFLRRRINSVREGEIEVFVNNIMGACLSDYLRNHVEICTGLVGPNTVEVKKQEIR